LKGKKGKAYFAIMSDIFKKALNNEKFLNPMQEKKA
jgi:hypothetical protein